MADSLGIGTQALSNLRGAAELTNLGVDALSVKVKKLAVNIGEATAGNGKAASAFKTLGISLRDSSGDTIKADAAIFAIADRFKEMQDGPEKAALAVRLFGKSGAEIIPLLNMGSEAIRQYGLAISDSFGEQADEFNDRISEIGFAFKNVAIEGLSTLLPTLKQIADAMLAFVRESSAFTPVFTVIGETVRLATATILGLSIAVKTAVNDINGLLFQGANIFSTFADGFINVFKSLAASLRAVVTGNFDALGQIEKDFVAFHNRNAERFKLNFAAISDQWKKSGEEIEKSATTQAFKRLLSDSVIFGDDDAAKRALASTAPAKRQKKAGNLSGSDEESQERKYERAEAAIRKVQEEGSKLRAEYALQEKTLGILTPAVEKQRIAIEENAKANAEAAKLIPERRDEYLKEAQAVSELRQSLIDLREAQESDPGVGVMRAVNDYLQEAQNVAAQTDNALSNVFKGAEDALVDFVTSGKLSFRDLANSLIKDISRIAIKSGIIAPLLGGISSLFGGGGTGLSAGGPIAIPGIAYAAKGGIMTAQGMLPLNTYSTGGIARSPQLAVFGEGRTPEAYVPLPDGKRIPVAMQGAPGETFNVSVTVNTSGGEQVAGDRQGAELGRAIAAAVRSELISQKRPGGLLA
jgi:lambda family phage tail tape measure protein